MGNKGVTWKVEGEENQKYEMGESGEADEYQVNYTSSDTLFVPKGMLIFEIRFIFHCLYLPIYNFLHECKNFVL